MMDRPTVTKDSLNAALSEGRVPAHLVPIVKGMRDFGIQLIQVPQTKESFWPADVKKGRGLIVFIGDDLHEALGPNGFNRSSLVSFNGICDAAVINSAGLQLTPYAGAAVAAGPLRQNVILVETRQEKEIEWLTLLQDLRGVGGIPILLNTPQAVASQ